MIEVVNVKDKLSAISDYWNPRIAASVNTTHVKLVKFQGEFTWHHHEHEDEMFYVVHGEFTMKLTDRDLLIRAGEFVVIPRGVEHKPVADREVHVLLIEPVTTVNTGNVTNEKTKTQLETI
ncbi:MAG: cupin domain-containing protein [Bacteroidetes bacterium]|nr:cupin domain-containing protein [Bacteroidota bacterium]